MISYSAARQPLIRVTINGRPAGGVMEASVLSCGGVAADRFRARFAVTGVGWDLTAERQLRVDIALGMGGGWQSLIHGQVDSVRMDGIRQGVSLEGRDLTALFIGTRLNETFSNRTASEVATLLAQRHGMQAVVDETGTLIGRYYESDHERTALNRYARALTEWDLLVQLAQQEDFEVFVSGDVLNFRQRTTILQAPALLISPQNCIEMRMEHALPLAQDISVTVRSWNSQQHVAIEETATLGRGGEGQSYLFLRPNLYPDQAQQLARAILSDMAGHEWMMEAVMPGDFTLTPRIPVRLVGTGTGFDGEYLVSEVDRSISEQGFVQRIRCVGIVTRPSAPGG